jgi:hypothetical protein
MNIDNRIEEVAESLDEISTYAKDSDYYVHTSNVRSLLADMRKETLAVAKKWIALKHGEKMREYYLRDFADFADRNR